MNQAGRIVAISTGGTKTQFANGSLYLGSKGAVEQFVRSLSRELGPRLVTANLSLFNRIGTSREVADVAAFLASDAARWITGQNLQAGGGVV